MQLVVLVDLVNPRLDLDEVSSADFQLVHYLVLLLESVSEVKVVV